MALPAQTARDLLPLVNDPGVYDMFLEYANCRIDLLRNELETAKDHDSILRIQGAIAEIRKIISLRDEVNADSKKKA